MEEKARHELLKSVYEQHWLHARHLENERLWFTNIYILIVGALLAYTFESGKAGFWSWPILIIIFVLSLAGFFMCHSLRIPSYYHSRMADIIQIKEWMLPYNYFYRKEELKTTGRFGLDPTKFIHFHAVFYWLYIVMSSLSIGFLSYDLAYDWDRHRLWIALVVASICFGILYGYFYKLIFNKNEEAAHEELEKLRNE